MKYFSLIVVIILINACSSPPQKADITFQKLKYSQPSIIPKIATAKKQHRKSDLRHNIENLVNKYGEDAIIRIRDWNYTISDYRRSSEIQKLLVANRFINRLKFVDDSLHWKKLDYWATPIETLASSGGDCEDFAIAKYYTLNKLGISKQCLHFNYVNVKNYDKPHMVLSYQCFEKDEPLILDNLNPKLLTASERQDIVPVYAFNHDGFWVSSSIGKNKKLTVNNRSRLWQDLQKRILKEQIFYN